MAGSIGQKAVSELGAGTEPFSKLVRKIVLLVGEDGFAVANCAPLLAVLRELAREVVVVTRSSGHLDEIENFGARVVDFDCRASLRSIAHDALRAWKLARILEAEDADAVHLIGARPATLGALALKLVAVRHVMVHLPDLNPIDSANATSSTLYRPSAAALIASLLRRPFSFLLLDSADDLRYLRSRGADPGPRFAVLGGAGIDPDVYPLLPTSQSEMPIAACIGPMVTSGGIDVLMRAFDRLWARGVRLQLELVGEHAVESDAIPPDEIAQWSLHPGLRRTEPVADMREVWRHAEICVLPAMGRLGLPRGLLIAAACGRALIVTHGAGGSTFVRHEVEGLVVPRGNVIALADAIERLARDAELRLRLGEAARLRVLQGFTEAHVKQTLQGAYLALLGTVRAA